jgi:hypothetical protein
LLQENGYQLLAGTAGFMERAGVELSESQSATGKAKLSLTKLMDVNKLTADEVHYEVTLGQNATSCEILQQCEWNAAQKGLLLKRFKFYGVSCFLPPFVACQRN